MTQDIEIHIDEIFLDRMPAGDPDQLRMAVEAGLAERIREQGWPGQLSHNTHIDQAYSRQRAAAASSSFGEELAGLIYHGISNPDALAVHK